jgi:hypothetical protein
MRNLKHAHLVLATCCAAALAGCASINEEVTEAVGAEFQANLTREGDPNGWGKAEISINDAVDQICTDLEVRDVSTVTAAHIHDSSGAVVVNLDRPDDDDSNDCDGSSDTLLDSIRRDPGSFYVDIHTTQYPDGAIRGRIFKE